MVAQSTRRQSPPPSLPLLAIYGDSQFSDEVGAQDLSTSPYSLSKENGDQFTDEFTEGMNADFKELQRMTNQHAVDNEQELTTSGRTYQELVEQNNSGGSNSSIQSEEDISEYERRKSVGNFLLGRNSISNWSTFHKENEDNAECEGGTASLMNGDMPSNVIAEKVRISSLETPDLMDKMDTSHVNTSQRRSQMNYRQRPSQRSQINERGSSRSQSAKFQPISHPRRSTASNNLSHISSSSSSMGEGVLGESWSSIRTSLDSSFIKMVLPMESAVKDSQATSQSDQLLLSPLRKEKSKSPIRSPLANIVPNIARCHVSPNKSPIKAIGSSPMGSYSLKEADGVQAQEEAEDSFGKAKNSAMSAPSGLLRKVAVREKTGEVDTKDFNVTSPEQNSTGISCNRSPAPTPNSQRRLIKRPRASLPAENYLIHNDLENANTTFQQMASRNTGAHKGFESDESVHPAYDNEFVFPEIPHVRSTTLAAFHHEAIRQGPVSHQYQLRSAGSNLLSLQEVILPSISYEIQAVLKKLQAKAQRNVKKEMPEHQGKDVVDVIEICRKVTSKCITHATKVAGKSWSDRQEQLRLLQAERYSHEVERQKVQTMNKKTQRKEERATARQKNRECQKYEKQKSHPRNKEMWQEVAKLMMDIQKIEKEERLWKDALVEIDLMEKNFQPPEKIDLDQKTDDTGHQRVKKQVELCKVVEGTVLESSSSNMIQDFTYATERINWILQSVSLAMDESERLRQEAFNKYENDGHKFYGCKNIDSKGLFIALSVDDSFGG